MAGVPHLPENLGLVAVGLPDLELRGFSHRWIPLCRLRSIIGARLLKLYGFLVSQTHGKPLFVEHVQRELEERAGNVESVSRIPLNHTCQRPENLSRAERSVCSRSLPLRGHQRPRLVQLQQRTHGLGCKKLGMAVRRNEERKLEKRGCPS